MTRSQANFVNIQGPRECAGTKLSDSGDGSQLWKCKSRNPSNKNPHLTKRCKLKCKKGAKRDGPSKVYCYANKGWVLRKSEDVISPGGCRMSPQMTAYRCKKSIRQNGRNFESEYQYNDDSDSNDANSLSAEDIYKINVLSLLCIDQQFLKQMSAYSNL